MKKVFLSFICFVLFLTSCSDFLNGSDLVNEINKTIEKANATVCDISIFSENNAFDFLGGKEKQIIKGEPVQFTCILDYENYKFNGFEPIATDNPSQRLDDYVKIDIVSSDEEKKNGTYKLEIRLLKEYPSIVIKLKSVLIPKVVSLEPEYDQLGVSCYRPIIFTFNQPMFKENLNDSFAKLTIVDSENNDFTKYYNNPVLSDDGKTLTVVPKYTEIEALVKENPYAEFVVKLSDDIYTANEDGSKSENKLKEAYTGKIRLIDIKDSIPPSFIHLSLFNNEEKERIFTSKAASEWNETTGAEFLQNAVSNSVYINAIGSDKESGIKSLYVKETLVNYSDGSPANVSVDGICEKAVFLEKQKNTFETATVPYELKTATDGLIKLDFFVTDYGNNNSPAITYYVVKYTKKSTKDNFSLYSQFTCTSGAFSRLENICMAPEEGKISVYSEKDSEHTYYFDKLICYDKIYNGIYSPMEIKVQYKEGSSAEWIELPSDQIQLSNATEYDLKNFPIVRRRPNLTTYVRFTAKNIVGEEHVLETQIPASDYVKNINIRPSTTSIDFSYSPFNANSASNCFIIITDENNKLLANYKGNPPVLNKAYYPDGFYYLYTIPFYEMTSENSSSNQVNIGTASTSYKIKIEWNGSTGTVTPIYDEAPSSITFPQVSLELLPPEINTGKRTVKVTTDYSNASENVRYRLLCYSNHDDFTVNEENIYEFTKYGCIQENRKFLFPENSDGEIVLKSGYTYNTKIVAYDLNNVNKGEINLPDIIDATFDNIISDTFSFTLLANSYNDFSLKSGSPVYLNETDLKKNEDNKVMVRKYIKKIESQSDRIYLSSTKLTKELLDKIPQADTEILLFDPVKTLQNDIPIRFDYLDYGLYSLIFMKEDNNGNYKIFCKTIYHKYKNGLELKKKSNTEIEFPNNSKTGDDSSTSYFDGTNFIKSTGHYNSGGATLPYLYNFDDYKGKFIKLSNYLESLSSDYRYYNVYFCPDYYLDNLTLKRKMMFKYDNEYQILADQPALIQLVQSDIKLTTEPEDWDMRGQTIEYKQISDDFLYTVDLSKITKKYYAVLVHFADGTTKMISETK